MGHRRYVSPSLPETWSRKTLILLERANVQRNLVVEQTDTAAHHGAIGIRWRNGKAKTRREVVVVANAVAIVAQAQIEHEARVHDPLVLHESRVFILRQIENAVTNKLDYLIRGSVCTQDADRIAPVSAVERMCD